MYTTPETLLLRWIKRARESSFAHYTAESRYSKLHYVIGVPAAVFSAIVGTTISTIFASLETTVDIRVKIVLGAISIITAILTGVQTFLRYSEQAERHRKTAVDVVACLISQLMKFPISNFKRPFKGLTFE
jgi:hypothetical protein